MDILPPARDEKGRVLPGHSLNPAGRPPLPPDVREALEAGSARAAERLVQLLESDDPRVVAMAANSVLDRLYGKPSTVSDVTLRQDDVGAAHLRILQELQQRRQERLAQEAVAKG